MNPTHRNIQTNPKIDERGLVNIYLPEGRGPFPFVMGIHGGGWCAGDRNSYHHFWPRIKRAGFAFVLGSYRISQEDHYPAAYRDLMHLLKWLGRHGHEYQLNPDRCGLLGGSAGGHLVMLLAAKGTREGTGSCKIRAAVDYCGIMDLAAQFERDNARGQVITFAFIGGNPTRKPSACRDASPIHQIHAKMPPVWMAHGTKDPIVPIGQSRRMAAKLRAAGHHPVYLEAKGRLHTLVKDDAAPKAKVEFLFEKQMIGFLKKHLLG
ncbi:MAG: alpha/beta hydrolase [Verrucomicrobiae bacterium]|nr:alpha/beta hydrolase [Verrucomicrobiae bacterium]